MSAAAAALLLLGLAGCGRIGYDARADDDGDDAGVDGRFLDTGCDMPVLVADLGPPATSPPVRYALDVTPTATGLVAVYQLGDNQLHATGVAVDGNGAIERIQTRGFVFDSDTADFSVAALGDMVQLAIDDAVGGRMALVDLSAYGYSNGATAYVETKRGKGHNFITADPASDRFVVVGINGTSSYRFTVDHDGDTVDLPIQVIAGGALVPEGVGAVTYANGYVAYAGTTSECTVAAYDNAWTPLGPPRTVSMTCHNMSVASAPGSSNVVPAWNCDNDQVWVTAGDVVAAALPAERSVFGASTMSASDPRVAPTAAGVWYAYAVAGGRLGRTLLDASGNSVPAVTPSDVYQNARVKAHDLVSRDGKAFLLWIESGPPADELYIMRMCTP